MKGWMVAASLCAVLCISGSAFAQCGGAKATADKAAGCTGAKVTADKGCEKTCGDKATATKGTCNGPKVTYKVGDKETCCSKEASELLAKNENASVRYVVAGKEYTERSEALQAYTAALEQYRDQMTQVRFAVGTECYGCPIEAKTAADKAHGQVKYRVASYNYGSQEQAAKAATAAKEAMNGVKMVYVVDGKEFCCDKMAKTACDKGTAAGATCHGAGEAKATAAAGSEAKTCDKAKTTADAGEGKTCAKTCDKAKTKTVALVELCDAKECLSKCAKGTMVYKVGDQATCCEASAKIALAQAQIAAAQAALQNTSGEQVAGL